MQWDLLCINTLVVCTPCIGPVVQLHEEDDTLSDSEDEQDPKFFDNNEDVTEETKVNVVIIMEPVELWTR